jgi:hypothetical protein
MVEDSPSRWADKDMEARRTEDPSGWLYLTQDRPAQFIIDALIDGSPRSFNKTELGEYAGFDRKTVRRHINKLVGLGIATEVETNGATRYRFDPTSPVSEAVLAAEDAVSEELADGAETNDTEDSDRFADDSEESETIEEVGNEAESGF